jgi:hypothetical protein
MPSRKVSRVRFFQVDETPQAFCVAALSTYRAAVAGYQAPINVGSKIVAEIAVML